MVSDERSGLLHAEGHLLQAMAHRRHRTGIQECLEHGQPGWRDHREIDSGLPIEKARKTATHSRVSTTTRYDRTNLEEENRVMVIRVAARKKM